MAEQTYEGSSSITPRDGKYCWTYEMNRLRSTYPLLGMLKISGWFGVAGFLAVYFLRGGNSGSSTILPLLCGFGITAIPVIFWFLKALISGKRALFRYEMDEEKITYFPEKKGEKAVSFSDVKSGKIWKRYDVIELRTDRKTLPVYVPSGDFSFVRDFMLDRIPEDTDLREME